MARVPVNIPDMRIATLRIELNASEMGVEGRRRKSGDQRGGQGKRAKALKNEGVDVEAGTSTFKTSSTSHSLRRPCSA